MVSPDLPKDAVDDYRATARLLATGLTDIAASTHDPVDMEWIYTTPPEGYVVDTWHHKEYFDNASDDHVILVNNIRPCNSSGVPYTTFDTPGFAPEGVKYNVFMQINGFDGHVLAHEIGHNCGLSHCATIAANQDRLMYWRVDVGNETLLAQSEVDDYE